LLYPVEDSPLGEILHDGVARNPADLPSDDHGEVSTLILACCDPAAGLLAHELANIAGLRLGVIPRSSRAALQLPQPGLVHAAGVHMASTSSAGNQHFVRRQIGGGYKLIRAARWQEGLAVAPQSHRPSLDSILKRKLRWIGREPGSGARQCLDELLA